MVSQKVSVKIGDNTYTVELGIGPTKISFEEGVETEFDWGTISSTIGIKKTDNGWEILPVLEPAYEPANLPQFEGEVDWKAVGIAVGVSVVLIVGILLLVPTGGGSSIVFFLPLAV